MCPVGDAFSKYFPMQCSIEFSADFMVSFLIERVSSPSKFIIIVMLYVFFIWWPASVISYLPFLGNE